jgi:hypothetical protein
MSSEIDLEAMGRSIRDSLGTVQSLIPSVKDQSIQYAAQQIWAALDEIERITASSRVWVSNHLKPHEVSGIDRQKMKVVKLLLEIRRAADIPMQLPHTLNVDHFFGQEAADSPPVGGEFA